MYDFMMLAYLATSTINFETFYSSPKETSYPLAVTPHFAQVLSPFSPSSPLDIGPTNLLSVSVSFKTWFFIIFLHLSFFTPCSNSRFCQELIFSHSATFLRVFIYIELNKYDLHAVKSILVSFSNQIITF